MKKDRTAFNLLPESSSQNKMCYDQALKPRRKMSANEVLSSLEQPLCVVPACCLPRGRAMAGCLDSWSQSQPGK